jgi:hypothetical protein
MELLLKRVLLYIGPAWVVLFISIQACSSSMPQFAMYSVAAILSTAWMFYGLWRFFFRPPLGGERQDSSLTHQALGFLAIVTVLLLTFSYLTGYRHDYMSYIKQWDIILRGDDPWRGTDNAYGPVHNLFASWYNIQGLLPKLWFSFLLSATGGIASFFPLRIDEKTSLPQRYLLFIFFILSPFALITVTFYGLNDILPAAAMVLAIIGAITFKDFLPRILSGGILAIGVMSKFYPIIILPSLSIQRRRIDWAFISGFLGVLVSIALLAYKIWGKSMLYPLLFAGFRGSAHLSLFHFTRTVLELNLDRLSTPVMLVVFLAMSLFLFKKNLDPMLNSILIFASVLSFYKVGHQQFFLFFFLISPYAIRRLLSDSNFLTPKLAAAFFVWIGFLNWYQLEYQLTCGLVEWPARFFRYYGALLYVLISGVLAVMIFKRIAAKDLILADSPTANR